MIAVGAHGTVCSGHASTLATDSNRKTSTAGMGHFSSLRIQQQVLWHFCEFSAEGFPFSGWGPRIQQEANIVASCVTEASAPQNVHVCRSPAGRPQGPFSKFHRFWTLLSSSRVKSVNTHIQERLPYNPLGSPSSWLSLLLDLRVLRKKSSEEVGQGSRERCQRS